MQPEYIVQIVNAIIWPLVILVMLAIFGGPLRGALRAISKLKYGDLEVSIREEVTQLAVDATQRLPKVEPSPAEDLLRNRLLGVAAVSPTAAVLEAWAHVQENFLELASRSNMQPLADADKKPLKLADQLVDAGAISPTQYSVFRGLRLLRNKTAHWERMQLSVDEAAAYVDTALRLAGSVRTQATMPVSV